MKSRKVSGCLTAVFVISLLAGILCGGIRYRTRYAKTEITTSASSDGQYTLTISMIGEPEWPFGATHCRFDLSDGSRKVVKYPFSIQDDGAMANEENFQISWYPNKVSIIVSGSEQEDRAYILHFDGTVE